MSSLIEHLVEFSEHYLSDKLSYGVAARTVPSWGRLVDTIPKVFREQANISYKYKIQGSIGRGNITEIPWLCIFDKEITQSAQDGYYIVLLYKSDMNGFYLSLNQGWTQYERQYGTRMGKVEIGRNAKKAQSILRTLSGTDISPLNLGATRALGKGYELGNICSFFHSNESPPSDDTLLEGLSQLMATYRELKGLVGKNIFNIQSAASEEDYQEQALISDKKIIPTGPIRKATRSSASNVTAWFRDPGIARTALENATYQCSVATDHVTFTSKATGNPFVEAHHLVPMEYQDNFEFSLDVPENIISLCPNCHKKIHLAKTKEMLGILQDMFNDRCEGLDERNISISFDQLKDLYS